jgi:mRNA-degrading endonuclease toxin of MazEF toxin-antitoxin module
VVSNNSRNAHLLGGLAVMITTTAPRAPRPSYVPLTNSRDSFEGWLVCDDIGPIRKEALGHVQGSLSPPTMRLVDIGLAAALSLPRPA